MASTVSSEKIGSRLYAKSFDHDPGATTAIVASPDGGTTKRYLDMGLYERLGVLCKPNVVGGGGLTKVEIIASAATDMSNPVVVKDSGTVAADALDDNVWLECNAAEVKALGDSYRYVAARLTMATATDEATVTYIAVPRNEYTGLTATSIA